MQITGQRICFHVLLWSDDNCVFDIFHKWALKTPSFCSREVREGEGSYTDVPSVFLLFDSKGLYRADKRYGQKSSSVRKTQFPRKRHIALTFAMKADVDLRKSATPVTLHFQTKSKTGCLWLDICWWCIQKYALRPYLQRIFLLLMIYIYLCWTEIFS